MSDRAFVERVVWCADVFDRKGRWSEARKIYETSPEDLPEVALAVRYAHIMLRTMPLLSLCQRETSPASVTEAVSKLEGWWRPTDVSLPQGDQRGGYDFGEAGGDEAVRAVHLCMLAFRNTLKTRGF